MATLYNRFRVSVNQMRVYDSLSYWVATGTTKDEHRASSAVAGEGWDGVGDFPHPPLCERGA